MQRDDVLLMAQSLPTLRLRIARRVVRWLLPELDAQLAQRVSAGSAHLAHAVAEQQRLREFERKAR